MMKLNKQTLSEQIYQILRSDILSQRIPSGTKLTLKSLTERFDVSSTPVREALTRLSEEQLVSYYSNVGVNVTELSANDLREIYEFMGDLDVLAISYAASSGKNTDALINELSENINEASNTLKHLNCAGPAGEPLPSDSAAADTDKAIENFIRLSDEFHLIFYKYCNNSRLTRSAERMRSQMSIAAYQYEKNTAHLLPIHEEHVRIFNTFRSGQYAEASELMKTHMKHSLKYALELTQPASKS